MSFSILLLYLIGHLTHDARAAASRGYNVLHERTLEKMCSHCEQKYY